MKFPVKREKHLIVRRGKDGEVLEFFLGDSKLEKEENREKQNGEGRGGSTRGQKK